MSASATRRLIWIPIIHTPTDLGSMGDQVRRLYIRSGGRNQWKQHLRDVEQMWIHIRQEIDRLGLDFHRVRLYQDGLPACGREEEIVSDLARAGSLNHQLLLDLIARGARLTGTESPALLLEEYSLAQQSLLAPGANRASTLTERRASSRQMLERRDSCIAERINETLQPGETGLVFLGMLHSLDGRLAPNTKLVRLDCAPQPGRGP